MENKRTLSPILQIIILTIGSLLSMLLTIVIYGLTYNFLERLFFPGNPQAFPAGIFRPSFAVVLVVLFLLVLRTKLKDIVKAIAMTGPMAAVIITIGFIFYQNTAVSVIAMLVAAAVCGALLYLRKRVWFYYYAGAIASAVAIIYAFPRGG